MIGAMIALGLGLIAGGVVGFVLGAEYAPEAVDRTLGEMECYRSAYRDGWRQCAAVFYGEIRRRAVEAKNTWTITKAELDRLEEEVTEFDSE